MDAAPLVAVRALAIGALLLAAARVHAIAVYLEDNQAWGLDGALIATVTTDALEHGLAHEDEQAHTALLTSAAGAGSSSEDDDGDGWLDQLPDDTVFLADTVNVTSKSAGDNSDSDSEAEADAWANAACCVDGCNSDSGSDSETTDESDGAMSYVNDCEPAYSPPWTAAQHLHAGGDPDCTATRTTRSPKIGRASCRERV